MRIIACMTRMYSYIHQRILFFIVRIFMEEQCQRTSKDFKANYREADTTIVMSLDGGMDRLLPLQMIKDRVITITQESVISSMSLVLP